MQASLSHDVTNPMHSLPGSPQECVLPGGSAKAFTRKAFAAHQGHPLLARPRPGQGGRRLLEDEVAIRAAPC